jgi:hypothetical protein
MAKEPKKTSEAAKAEAGGAAVAEAGTAVGPVVAVNKIVYGDRKVAVPGSLFTPTSQKESDDLFALKAVRKPNDAELAIFAKLSAPAPQPAATTPAAAELAAAEPKAAPAAHAPETPAASAADENPLG